MSDLSITAGNVVKGSDAVTERGHAGAAITAGQQVYLDTSDNLYKLADSDGGSALVRTPRGTALNSASANQPLDIQKDGDITIGATLTPGTTYYLSDNAGGICPLADLETGDYFVIVGIAKSASVLSLSYNYSAVAKS